MQSAPRPATLAAHVDVRLVHRVAERVAGVAEHHDGAGLRHERAHVADRALDHDVDALERDAAAGRGVAADDAAARRAPVAPAAWLALPSTTTRPDIMFSATPDAGVAVHADGRVLVHAGAVVAGVALDHDLDRRRRARRRCRARRTGSRPASGAARAPPARSCRRWFRSRSGVWARSTTSAVAVSRAPSDARPLPDVRRAPARAPRCAASSAPGQHRDRAELRRHRHPVVGLRHHRRLAGDRVAEDREAVGRADREGVEAVQVVEAGLSASSSESPSRSRHVR